MEIRDASSASVLFVFLGLATSCKGPVTSPEELAKVAESARAAMSAAPSALVDPSSQQASAPAPPALVPQPFKVTAPSAACASTKAESCALDLVDGTQA